MRFPEKWVLALLLGFAWLADGGVRAIERRVPAAPLLAVAMLELVLSFRAHFPWSDPRVAFAPSPAIAAIHSSWDGEGNARLWDPDVHTKPGLPRWPGATLATDLHRIVYPNTGVRFGIGYLFGTSALRVERSVRTVRAVLGAQPSSAAAILRRLGVDYWIVYDPTALGDLEPLHTTGLEVGLLRDRKSGGVARVAALSIAPDWPTLVSQLSTAGLDRAWALAGDPGVDRLHPTDGHGTAAATRLAAGHWRVAVEASDDAAVVLTEAWAPGWSASIDGGPRVEAVPLEGMLVGIAVPAGNHEVDLRFDPPGLAWGMRCAILGALAIAVLAFRPGRAMPG